MSCKGTNIAAVAVDHFAKCTLENMLYGPFHTSANVNMLSQVKISHQVATMNYIKTDGQRLEFGGNSQYRVSKSLDYMNAAVLYLTIPQIKLRNDTSINLLASLRMSPNWIAKSVRRTRLYVQDLLLTESDTFAQLMHVNSFIRYEHRENMNVMMGNTEEFLGQGAHNGSDFDPVGLSRECAVPLALFAVQHGSVGNAFVSGAAIFNDIHIEVELNELADVVEIHNGPCGTQAIDGTENGRAATFADVETCDGNCPEVINSYIMVDGAVGSPEEKKALARMVATRPIKLYSYTITDQFNPYGETVTTLRLSLGLVAILAAVVNVTHGRASCNFSTLPNGLGVSPWEEMELRYENTVRHCTTPILSIHSHTSFAGTPGEQLGYFALFPFSFDFASPHLTSSLQASRVSDMVLHTRASAEAGLAADGFDQNKNAIPVAQGHEACIDSGNDNIKDQQNMALPGQKQRFVVSAVAAQVAILKYVRGSLQMVV